MLTALALTLALAAGCSPPRTQDVVTPPRPARDAIYEVFTRDFSPAGNFQGVMDGLDRIQASGANIIWLMPVHPIGVKNRKEPLGSSYSVVDYRAINPDYGDAADFRRLVNAVHARGMKLIIDWVPNHTAWDHVWVSRYPARYIRDSAGAMSTPRDNEGKLTDWTDVADLDYSSDDLRRAMIADMRYWLDEFGIDGFRVDVAGMVPDDFWRSAVPQLRAVGRPILLLAEWGELKMHNFGYDLSYGWDSYSALKSVWKGEPATKFVEQALADQAAMPAGGGRLRFTTNHDETAWDLPPITLFGGPAGARAAFVAMALLPGVPMLYNGQEVESPQKLGLFVKEPVAWNQPNAAKATAFYRKVIELARTHQAFGAPLQTVTTNAPAEVISYRRGNVVVLVNTRANPLAVTPTGVSVSGARDLLTGGTQQENVVQLAGHGALVLELKP
jgi:glycosidase